MLSYHSPWGVMPMSCGMKLIAAADRATPAGELLHKQSMHHACSLLTCASATLAGCCCKGLTPKTKAVSICKHTALQSCVFSSLYSNIPVLKPLSTRMPRPP